MKLTRRLLAVVLSVAMLLGMVAVGATASITDYYEYDPVDNPYTGKIGLKAYKVNTEDGTYTEIENGAVEPGDVVRVEIWVQTNYFHTLSSFGIAYSNGLYVPTTLDYSTYNYLERASSVSYPKVFAMTEYDADHADSAEGTIDNPWYLNEVVKNASSGYVGKTKAQNYANIKKYMPPAWRGTGTTATTYYADEKYTEYNYLYAGYMADTNGEFAPYPMNGIIVTEYQPSIYFNLTVSADAQVGDTGIISIPEEGIYTSKQTASTYLARCYATDEDGDGIGDEEAAAAADGLQYIYPVNNNIAKDTYGTDETIYERVYDMSEATLTLTVGGATEEPTTEEPTTEAPVTETTTEEPTTEAPVVVDKTALKTAIDTVPAIAQDKATSASWKAYTDALAKANEVYAAEDATQDEVNAAAEALVTATNGVTALGACDYAALDEAIAAASALKEADYTPDSWAAADLATAISAGEAVERDMVADEAGANQGKIDDAKAAIDAAVAKLEEKADLTALQAAINTEAVTDGCTEESVKAYTDALAAAQALNSDNTGVSKQAEVNAAAEALLKAIDGLTPIEYCDYTVLEAAKDAYEDKANAKEYDLYTTSSWDVYAQAYLASFDVEENMIKSDENQAIIDAAVKALNDAEAALVLRGDTTELAALVAEVKALDASLYTAESYAALAAPLADAEAIVADNSDSSADDVTAAYNALNAAKGALELLGGCDYTALDAAIKAYTGLVKADYKPTSWDESGVDEAYDKALAVDRTLIADEDGVNQAAINAAATALTDAIAKLDPVANKAALEAAIARASALSEASYTPESWEAADLATVLTEANAVLVNNDATDEDVADAISAIEYAESLLVKKADKSALLAAIEAAKALVESDYTPDSWSASDLEMIIEEAEGVYADENADAENVASAIESLENSVEMLVPVANKDALLATLNEATSFDASIYTEESAQAVRDNIASATDVYYNENATQEEVDKAEADLRAALDALVPLGACDYTALDEAIAAAKALVEDNYTTSSWTAADLATVIKAGEAVERDMINDAAGYSQGLIDDAKAAIDEAVAKLEEKADMSALEDAVAAEPKVAEEYATTESWTAYAQAKAEAEDILANAADTGVSAQAAVDAAAKALNDANDALVEEAADYSKVDAAMAKIPADLSGYTQASVAALNKAVNAVVEGLGKSKQDDVDAYAAAIEKAIEGLKVNKAAITALDVDLDGYMKKSAKEYTFTVTGAPSKIQVKGQNGTTGTYDRYHSRVTIVSYNAAGETYEDLYLYEEPAYEEWTIVMSLGEGPFTAKAKFDNTWETEVFEFEVTMYKPREAAVTFLAKAKDSADEAGKALSVKKGTAVEITVVAPTTVKKVQLLFKSGTTSTYTANHSAVTYVDNGDGTATWTILRTFNGVGVGTMTLKLKDASGWYTAATEIISTEVTK